jgi:uncharacterized cupredoxin-like copper-binding protein
MTEAQEASRMRTLTIRSTVTVVAAAVASMVVAAAVALLAGTKLAFAADRHTTATTIQVSGGEFFFKLSSKSLAKPGSVTFVFKNVGHVVHNLNINGKTTPLMQPGKSARLVVVFRKSGRYPYLCTVPGHAAAGMKGVFTVR